MTERTSPACGTVGNIPAGALIERGWVPAEPERPITSEIWVEVAGRVRESRGRGFSGRKVGGGGYGGGRGGQDASGRGYDASSRLRNRRTSACHLIPTILKSTTVSASSSLPTALHRGGPPAPRRSVRFPIDSLSSYVLIPPYSHHPALQSRRLRRCRLSYLSRCRPSSVSRRLVGACVRSAPDVYP